MHGSRKETLLRSEHAGTGGIDDATPVDAVLAKGTLLFDAKNALFSLAFDDALIIAGTKRVSKKELISSYTARTLLTDGKSTLVDILQVDASRGILVDNVEVYPDPDYETFRSLANFVYPVSKSQFTTNLLFNDLASISNGKATLKSAQVERREDSGKQLRLTLWKPPGVTREYVIDLYRGAVPVEIKEFGPDGKLMSERFYGDLRPIVGGWFPFRKRVNMSRAGVSEILRVADVDFSSPVKESSFSVRFREPVTFTDRVTSTVQTEKSYSLIERSRSPAKTSKKITVRSPAVTGIEGGHEVPAAK